MYNLWHMTGRLTKDIDIKPAGKIVMAFIYVACRRKYKNKENGEYESDFFRLKAFGKSAEFAFDHLKKGDLVQVEGCIKNNNYQKEDGEMIFQDDYLVDRLIKVASPKK